MKLTRKEVINLSIREVRLKMKIKAKTLCELIGVKRITYYKKESGKVKFSLDEAKKISDYMEKPIEEIFFADKVSKTETYINS